MWTVIFKREYFKPSRKKECSSEEDVEDSEDGSAVTLDVAMDRYARLYLGI